MKAQYRLLLVLAVMVPVLLAMSVSLDTKPVNKISFATALGFDRGSRPGTVTVHALIAIPGNFKALAPGGQGGPTDRPTVVLSAEAPSISSAIDRLGVRMDRQLDLSQAKVLLYSDELAREGVRETMDWIARVEGLQFVALMGVTEGSTKRVLDTEPQITESPSDFLLNVFTRSGSRTSAIIPLFMWRFYSQLLEPGWDSVMPVIGVEEGQLIMKGSALFRADRMKLRLSPEQSSILALLQNDRSVVHVATEDQGRAVALRLLQSKTRTELKWKGNTPALTIQITAEGSLQEREAPGITEFGDVFRMNDLFSREVARQAVAVVTELQKAGVDPLGFWRKYYLQQGDTDGRWWAIYPAAEIQVSAHITIRRRNFLRR